MDATPDKNSEYLALGFKNDFTVLMKRTQDDKWPHAEVRFPEVDLDKYPIFKFHMTNPEKSEFSIVIKAVDPQDEKIATITTREAAYDTNHEIDLRKFSFSGKRKLTFKIYYIGMVYVQPPGEGTKYVFRKCKPGSYWVIDTIGFAPEVKAK
jgi:hypothetical protein